MVGLDVLETDEGHDEQKGFPAFRPRWSAMRIEWSVLNITTLLWNGTQV